MKHLAQKSQYSRRAGLIAGHHNGVPRVKTDLDKEGERAARFPSALPGKLGRAGEGGGIWAEA